MHTSIILHGPNKNLTLNVAYDLAAHFIVQKPDDKNEYTDADIARTVQHISDDIHPSVFIAGDLSIETMRSMQEFLAQKPLVGINKCAIIPNCNDILKQAANSCLKVIEESGNNNLIIITTESIASLLATIRSRCYKIYIKDNAKTIHDYQNEHQYILSKYKDLDNSFLTKFVDFLNKELLKHYASIDDINAGKIFESIKTMDEIKLEAIPNILLSYLEFKMHSDAEHSIAYAKKMTNIHHMTRNARSQDQQYLALLCILHCIR